MEDVSGVDAIRKMRQLKMIPNSSFGIVFITCSLSHHQRAGEVRRYDKCRLRSAMVDEGLTTSADHYIYFTDLESDQPKQCFKKLIRKVCFDNVWYNINWFKE